MTPSEFQAWLDGFSEGVDGHPIEKQWAKALEKALTLQTFNVPDLRATYPIQPNVMPTTFYGISGSAAAGAFDSNITSVN